MPAFISIAARIVIPVILGLPMAAALVNPRRVLEWCTGMSRRELQRTISRADVVTARVVGMMGTMIALIGIVAAFS